MSLQWGRFVWLTEPVRDSGLSPDGRWISATHADRVAVYERASGREVCALPTAVNASPEVWWCADDAALVQTYREGRAWLERVVVPDGGVVASRAVGYSRAVFVGPRGELVARLVWSSPDALRLEVLDAATLETLRVIEVANTSVSAAYSTVAWMRPDGAALIARVPAGRDRGQFVVVDLVRGVARALANTSPRHRECAWLGPSRVLLWHRDGGLVVFDVDRDVAQWSIPKRESGSILASVSPTPGGDRVACIFSTVQAIRMELYEPESGVQAWRFTPPGFDALTLQSYRWRSHEGLEGMFLEWGRWWLGRWSIATGERVWALPLTRPVPTAKRPRAARSHATERGDALVWEVGYGRNDAGPPRRYLGWCLDDAPRGELVG